METYPTVDRAALRAKIKKGLRLFVLISTLTILGIYFFTATEKTWSYFQGLKPAYLVAVFFVWLLYLAFDGLRLRILAGALGGKVDLKTAAEVILTGLFLAAVTPFQIGGFPVQLYILNKRSLSIGKSTLVLLFRGLLTTILLAPVFVFVFIVYREYFSSALIKGLFFYLSIVFPVGLALFILFMVFPEQMRNIFLFLRRKRTAHLFDRFFTEVLEAKSGLARYYRSKKLHLVYAFVVTIASTACYYLITLVIILGLGLNTPKLDVVVLSLLLNVVLMFIPTPGASGVAEAGFATLFSTLIPRELLTIGVILWRFFTFYLGVIIGGIILLNMLKPPKDSKEDR